MRRRILAEHPGIDEEAADDRARLVALTAYAFIRHAWINCVEHPDANRTLQEFVDDAFATGAALVAEG